MKVIVNSLSNTAARIEEWNLEMNHSYTYSRKILRIFVDICGLDGLEKGILCRCWFDQTLCRYIISLCPAPWFCIALFMFTLMVKQAHSIYQQCITDIENRNLSTQLSAKGITSASCSDEVKAKLIYATCIPYNAQQYFQDLFSACWHHHHSFSCYNKSVFSHF